MPVPTGAKAGKISKPYGLGGEINIILDPEAGKSIEAYEPLFIDIDGQRIPFFVEYIDIISEDQAILKVEFIESVMEARAVCGCDIYLGPDQARYKGKDLFDLHDVISYRAFDGQKDLLGTISEFIPDKNNPLFIIDYKGKELMVPAAEEIIVRIDHKTRAIHFNLPEGLTEL